MLHHLSADLVLVFLIFVRVVEPKGVLKVRFVDFVNPGQQDYDGGCCDPVLLSCNKCETYFEICLQKYYAAVAQKKCIIHVTTKQRSSDKFTFGTSGFGTKGEKNPLVYKFDNTWKGEFSIYMTVYDDDSGHILGIGKARDKIDIVREGFRYLIAGQDSQKPNEYRKPLTGVRKYWAPTITSIVISLYCSPDYYDAYCGTYCKAQNSDSTGHYTCETGTGVKICRSGWQGKDCKKAICKRGCKNGHCNKPGECICAINWTGGKCDQCIPSKGCLNGNCVKGGDCLCRRDWSGPLCDQDKNACRSNPCQNGARCVNIGTKYHCQCVPGYKGAHCEHEINLCSSNPCVNNGTCNNFRTDFQCRCPPGFKGRKCEQNIDECKLMNYCVNGATCIDGINNFTCNCLPGFDGRYCDHDIDECSNNPCLNGICKDGVNNYTCSCINGFMGRQCDENIDDCDPNPCKNNGNCTDDVDDYLCSCAKGWVSKDCSSNHDECNGNPCRNNGTCHDSINDYNCICPVGFTGKDCQININDCKPNPCQPNGACVDGVDSYVCQCKPGFSGQTCAENINECKVSICLNGGQCVDGINQYHCKCPPGFGGQNCEINIDECAARPCFNNASCTDGIANFFCNCSLGYKGHHCDQRIDYCKGVTCQYHGQCVNELGGYRCYCRNGFNGTHCKNTPCTWAPCRNGGKCKVKESSVRGFECNCGDYRGFDGDLCENDVDNCDPKNHDFAEGIGLTENGLCGYHGHCIDYVGHYVCNCSEGWRGLMCQKDIRCNNNPCQNNGECKKRINKSGYFCVCATGYNGTNCETMVNLCDQNPCCDGAICSHGLNSFTCDCTNGLKGPSCCSNTTWCSPDLFNVPTCNNHSRQCTSLEDKFDCSCQEGYTGIRCETDIDECLSNPCINGKCANLPGTYECKCYDPDMTGKNCDERINDCQGVVACQNNGICVDGVLNYTCKCQGYVGRHCEIELNECEGENDCNKTHSDCINTKGSYYCKCHQGYHDPPACKRTIDYCSLKPCDQGGCSHDLTLRESVAYGYTCICYPGWKGYNCSEKIQCDCGKYGYCETRNGEEICRCNHGYEGSKCSDAIVAESRNNKEAGPNILNIGIPFLTACVLLAFVAAFVAIRWQRRRNSRRRDVGGVESSNVVYEDIEGRPKPMMFINPIYGNKKMLEQQTSSSNGEKDDLSWVENYIDISTC